MKKIILIFFLLALVIPNWSIAAVFLDVWSNYPHRDGIAFVKKEGMVSGYSDGTYRPNNSINRAEFTKIIISSLYLKEDIDDCDTSKVPFLDVKQTAWYAPFVCTAYQNNIITGYPDGSFQPGNTINFAEAAKIVVHTYLDDVPEGDPWYEPSVLILEKLNAIPTDIRTLWSPLTRGQMAEIVYRLLEGVTNKQSLSYEYLEKKK